MFKHACPWCGAVIDQLEQDCCPACGKPCFICRPSHWLFWTESHRDLGIAVLLALLAIWIWGLFHPGFEWTDVFIPLIGVFLLLVFLITPVCNKLRPYIRTPYSDDEPDVPFGAVSIYADIHWAEFSWLRPLLLKNREVFYICFVDEENKPTLPTLLVNFQETWRLKNLLIEPCDLDSLYMKQVRPGMRFLIYHGRTQMGSGTVTNRMVYGE